MEYFLWNERTISYDIWKQLSKQNTPDSTSHSLDTKSIFFHVPTINIFAVVIQFLSNSIVKKKLKKESF